jgi:tetratricopeptide (TPR) repeat protein
MKNRFKIWMVTLTAVVWLWFLQPAQALNIPDSRLSQLNNRSRQAIVSQLPEATRSELKLAFMMNKLDFWQDWSRDCLNLSGKSGVKACLYAIALHPENPTAWNNLGHKLFRLDDFDRALLAYNHALLLNPESSLVLANRCSALSAMKRYSEALASCELALQGDGHWGFEGEILAWNNRGDVLFNLERYEESLASFERALAINPSHKEVNYNRTVVLRKLEHYPPKKP